MKTIGRIVPIILILSLCISCENKNELHEKRGMLEVSGGKIWYEVKGSGSKTPILLLHGGPGYPSHYLNPLKELAKERPVIMFDQLGSGRSERITDTSLMTIDAHIEQIQKLLDHLGINEFYLYGHSWGTMLATDFYLKDSEGVKAMILASPCLSVKHWEADADTLIATLPDSIALILNNEIAGVEQDSIKLSQAITMYYDQFLLRKQPVPQEVDSADLSFGENVYYHMWGTSEFFATGTLKNYDRTADLQKINVPTLYTTGEFDEARPTTVKYYQSLTPNAEFVLIPEAAHLTMQDNPVSNLEAISSFLRKLE